MKFLISLTLSLLLVYCNAQGGSFELIIMRVDNTLILNCRDTLTALNIQNPSFWINTTMTELRERLAQRRESYSATAQGFIFTINRELEGLYFCGRDGNVNIISQMITIVAYPQLVASLKPITVTVKKGEDAVLRPLVNPGMLLGQYFIDWRNRSSNEAIATVQGPRFSPTSIFNPDSRYSVDPNSFALTIRSVTFSDRELYLGVVGVADPEGQDFLYTQTENVGIALEVYVPPKIIKGLENEVVVLENDDDSDQTVTYYCEVKGYPSLAITWIHNDFNVARDPEKYRVLDSNEGETILKSSLTILDLENHDSGNVTCRASVGGSASINTSTASLSVLGEVERVSTFITVSKTVVFRVFLVRPIAAEVQLFIKYTDTETQATSEITTSTRFAQSQEITHFENSMPFQRFTVEVALVYRSRAGPLIGDRIVYDRSLPTELSIILVTFLVPGLFLLVFLITVAVVVIVVLCLCFGRKQGLKCCYSVNTAGERALFLKNKIDRKREKMNTYMPSEEAACGPTSPRRIRWQPFCCRETDAEKDAKHHISELLRLSISGYANPNDFHRTHEDNTLSDDTKDTLSRSSKDPCSSDEEIPVKVTCL